MVQKKRAVLYLRSSKDRSDASPDAQRRALKELASQRELVIVGEYVDAVESGKDENRPGFQKLIADVRNAKRGWEVVLVLDTSRVARRRQIALMFEEVECRKAGVQVVYKNLPDADPITEMLLKSILQAMDEWHSLTSRQKGLAGMAENVKQGYRAGGRAPHGYRLKVITTGAVRDGEPVTKSVLELDPKTHEAMANFLADRAAGTGRVEAARRAGLTQSGSSLIGFEWNALTYAGHTVWNVHAEQAAGGYVGGSKRRPRNEWVIQRDTHPALIDDAQAEAILRRREAPQAGTAAKRRARDSGALLAGLLHTEAGAPWWAEGAEYRCSAGRGTVSRSALDAAVLAQVANHLRSDDLTQGMMESARVALANSAEPADLGGIDAELAELERRTDRLLELAVNLTDPAPALRKVDETKGRRAELAQRRAELLEQAEQARALANVSEGRLRGLLRDLAGMLEGAQGDEARTVLLAAVERVLLEPGSSEVTIVYRVDPTRGPGRGGRLRAPAAKPGLTANRRGDATLTPATGSGFLRCPLSFSLPWRRRRA